MYFRISMRKFLLVVFKICCYFTVYKSSGGTQSQLGFSNCRNIATLPFYLLLILFTMPVNNPLLATNFCACAPRQVAQLEIFGDNIQANRSLGNIGFLQFLTSPMNRAGFTVTDLIKAGNGKGRTVQIQMDDAICPQFCSTTIDCAVPLAAQSGGITCEDFNIKKYFHLCSTVNNATVSAGWVFDRTQWLKYCEQSDDAIMQRQFAKVNQRLAEHTDKELVADLRLKIPVSQNKKIPFFITNTTYGQPVLNPQAMFAISQFERDGGYDGDYVLMGGSLALQLINHLRVASASAAGYDITRDSANYPPIYYDRNFDTSFPNSIVVVPWKSIQLVSFNDFEGERALEVPNLYKHATTAVPLGNGSVVTIDYKWKYDDNCEKYVYDPRMWAELWVTKPGGCGVNAEFNGIIVVENCGPTYAVECPPPPPAPPA